MRIQKLFLFLVLVSSGTLAQSVITNADLPSAGDTFRISQASPATTVDLSLTGPNYNWDFSALAPVSQTVDSFVSVSSTGFVYQLVFGFGGNASNLVQKGPGIAAIPQVQITDVFAFFNNSTTNFRQVGYGGTLQGIQTPMAFGNKDFIYNFPLNFGDQDSCNSDYGISLPGLGAYQAYQKRVNIVDGWGTVITPYGTFSALRVVSELSGTDSLYLDTLGQGFLVPRPLTREYKWLAPGEGVPVLQINTQLAGAIEQISAIRYKDSLLVSSVNDLQASVYGASISPNPSSSSAIMKSSQESSGEMDVLVTDLAGRFAASIRLGTDDLKNGVDLYKVVDINRPGIYLLHLRGNKGTELIRWVRN